ncbi:uncharacterized protein LOC124281690 [Haliotis rubra]|uniref:uncharacterized protein LOC124281690 n=1 Tax=Haliotis rubra TaxID=36100 RepID=UPI001EE602FF|nr:uncharacterized protein LOC124281690 [Haliotis rubra]
MNAKKGNRKPNWTSDECLSLVQLVESKKEIIRGKFSSRITSEEKKMTWMSITESINASHPHVIRSNEEVEKKWYNLLSKSRQEIAAYRRGTTATGGGPSTSPLSAVASTVESILGEANASISGLDNGIDTSMLQFINLSPYESDCLDVDVPVSVPAMVPDPAASTVPVPASVQLPVPVTDRKRELELKVLEAQLEYYQLKIKKLKRD